MDDRVLQQVLAAYGIPGAQLISIQKGYRNSSHQLVAGGRQLNLILYKNEPAMLPRIRQANRVGDFLAAQGLPARRTSDPRILRLKSGGGTRYAALYEYLPGHTIPWEAYTKEHIKQLGAMMAAMHRMLRTLPRPATNQVADDHLAILQRMERYFTDLHVTTAMARKLGVQVKPALVRRLQNVMHICQQLPGQHTLHMDFVRGNILFEGSSEALRISGIIDFEKTAYGHPLFDIARTLAFLLVDCKYKDAQKVQKYFLQSGYVRRGQMRSANITINYISKENISIFDNLLDLFLLYDFYKFLRHNPYEDLNQNEHYVRTKQISINRNILQSI